MTGSSTTSAAPEQARSGGAYDDFVARSPQGCVFATSWWLDAVAPESWRPHAVEEAGEIVGAWPTVVRESLLGDLHLGAPLTPFLGPLLAPDESVHRRSREGKALESLLEALTPFAHLEARCHPAFDYWTPLHWHGFTQTTHYTWRLPDVADLDAVFAGMRENIRREIRKAEKQELAVAEGGLADVVRMHEQTAERQHRLEAARSNRETIARIDAAAGARDARTILLARDAGGRVHAGAYFVSDERYTYYLFGGSDPELRTSGAASLVMWAGIQRAAERGTGFDFEGSMLRHLERFVRAFGGVPTPYSIVRSTPSLVLRSAVALKRGALLARERARSR